MSLFSLEESKYKKHFIIDHIFKNQSIEEILKKMYSPPAKFIQHLLELRNDYEISYTLQYDNLNNNSYPKDCKFTYSYIHPIAPERKQIMGPSKININDDIHVIYFSPNKLYIEYETHLSGFMLMDTFISRTLYIFDKMNNDVCLNIKYDMEFIKQHFFTKMMEDSSYKENEETFRDLFIPEMDKFLNGEFDTKDKDKVVKEEEENEEIDNDMIEYNYWLFYASL